MSAGEVIHTAKGGDIVSHVVEDAGGMFAISARVGPREGVVAVYRDKAAARALSRAVVGAAELDGFTEWLASRDCMERVF